MLAAPRFDQRFVDLFWADHPAGSDAGVAPPRSWRLEYWRSGWTPVTGQTSHGIEPGTWQDTSFHTMMTHCLRAVFDASGHEGAYAGLAV